MLDDGADHSRRVRYTLETMLSALGVAFEFVDGEGVAEAPSSAEFAYLGKYQKVFDNSGDTPVNVPEGTFTPARRGSAPSGLPQGLSATYLVVGPTHRDLMERISRETAVVVLPEPDVGFAVGAGEKNGETGRNAGGQGCGGDREKPSAPVPGEVGIASQTRHNGHLIEVTSDIIGPAFRLLSRCEEYAIADRDQHDRFQWIHSPLQPAGLATRPLASEYAHILLESLREACTSAGMPVIRKELWPLGKPVAGCLSHDVDVVRRGKLPRGVAVRDVTGMLSSVGQGRLLRAAGQAATITRTVFDDRDPYWTFDQIGAIERSYGYRSTYFFMAANNHPEDVRYRLSEPRMARLLRELAELDCELALHGSYASYTDGASLRRQRALLEEQAGQEVAGHRNHLLRFRAPHSWRAQESAGFSYDSTLGFADHEGFRGGSAFPFYPYDLVLERRVDLLEIPLAVMDATLRKYRHLRGDEAEMAMQAVLEDALAVNGLATLLWHNDSFYEPEFPGLSHLYEAALAWLSEKDAYVGTCREIDRWWRSREAVRLSPLEGSRNGWRLTAPEEIEGLVLRVRLPDPRPLLRLHGQVPIALRRDGSDHLLEFGRLPAGSSVEIEYS